MLGGDTSAVVVCCAHTQNIVVCVQITVLLFMYRSQCCLCTDHSVVVYVQITVLLFMYRSLCCCLCTDHSVVVRSQCCC